MSNDRDARNVSSGLTSQQVGHILVVAGDRSEVVMQTMYQTPRARHSRAVRVRRQCSMRLDRSTIARTLQALVIVILK